VQEHTAVKKLIVLDPSLKNMGGHFYEYDVALAEAASRRGMQCLVYAHRSCGTGLTIPGGEIHPWFSTEWSAAGGRTKNSVRFLLGKLPVGLRIPLARLGRLVWNRARKKRGAPADAKNATVSAADARFQKEVTDALCHGGCGSDDIIFVPTIRTSELYAVWKDVQQVPDFQHLQFHIVLRRDAAEMDLPEAGAPGISFLFREMLAKPAGRAFRFYCDTGQLCDDYAALSSNRIEFRILPIPFPNADPDPIRLEKWAAGPAIKLVYLGGARAEKGFHLLAAAQDVLRKKYPGKLLWRLQAPLSGGLEEPEVSMARQRLLSVRDGSVELVEQNLSPAEFQSLLLSADIVLLPYLPGYYRARSSGILVQVLAAGKPVIVPAGSWLSSQTGGLGAVEFREISGFPEAILQALQQRGKLTAEAQGRATAYARLHSADALLDALVTVAGTGRDK
jgi:glycosyltransferase involved in cell wall biosynthesis